MIAHVYERAAACRSLSGVIVATDDPRIADAVQAFGGEIRMTRADHATGTDRLAEVAATLDCDVVVNVQGDEPMIAPSAIAAAVAPFASDPDVQMTTLCRRIERAADLTDPNIVKLVVDRAGNALYFSRAPIPFVRGAAERGGSDALPWTFPFYRHIGLYAYRRKALLVLASLEPTPLERAESLEQLRALEHGIAIRAVQTDYDGISVDTPDDLARVREALDPARAGRSPR